MSERQEEARITIRLSPQARQAVEEVMKLGGFKTIQEAVRRAIGDELFLLQQRKEGWTVMLRKGNEAREMIWPNSI
jgi:hypothetical protein